MRKLLKVVAQVAVVVLGIGFMTFAVISINNQPPLEEQYFQPPSVDVVPEKDGKEIMANGVIAFNNDAGLWYISDEVRYRGKSYGDSYFLIFRGDSAPRFRGQKFTGVLKLRVWLSTTGAKGVFPPMAQVLEVQELKIVR